jgi:hypothetical protein
MFESLIRSVKTADKEFDVCFSTLTATPLPSTPLPPCFSTCVTHQACSNVSKFVRNFPCLGSMLLLPSSTFSRVDLERAGHSLTLMTAQSARWIPVEFRSAVRTLHTPRAQPPIAETR